MIYLLTKLKVYNTNVLIVSLNLAFETKDVQASDTGSILKKASDGVPSIALMLNQLPQID